MKAKVIKPFFDKKEGVVRSMGDTFELSEERYKEINSTKFGELVKEIKEAAEKKITKKKTTKKG